MQLLARSEMEKMDKKSEHYQARVDIAFYNSLDDLAATICKLNDKAADGFGMAQIQKRLCKMLPIFLMLAGIDGDRTMTDLQMIEAIRKIVEKGNNAEVKKRKDGSLVVYEVKKHIAAG